VSSFSLSQACPNRIAQIVQRTKYSCISDDKVHVLVLATRRPLPSKPKHTRDNDADLVEHRNEDSIHTLISVAD